jgi:ribosomal protein S18 acetylase RimI-like enzyme
VATIREAVRADNDELLALTALTPMDGRISIGTDRSPDFFRLLESRGPSRVLVAEESGRIVGAVSTSLTRVRVAGQPEPVHYLGDLRVHPGHRGLGLAEALLWAMREVLLADGADLILATAAFGNDRVRTYFEGRGGLPRAVPLGEFRIYQLLPARGGPRAGRGEVREAALSTGLLELYRKFYEPYQFAPLPEVGPLSDARHWQAASAEGIAAGLSLIDVGEARRNILFGLPFVLGHTAAALRALGRVLPLPELPRVSEPIRMLYVRMMACRPGREDALAALIQEARSAASGGRYHFVAFALHERDPLSRLLPRFPRFVFRSQAYVIGLRRRPDELLRLAAKLPYEDYSLV